jgi:hypothetical protein
VKVLWLIRKTQLNEGINDERFLRTNPGGKSE